MVKFNFLLMLKNVCEMAVVIGDDGDDGDDDDDDDDDGECRQFLASRVV